MKVEQQYEDVLQNMEFAIVDTYHGNRAMTDYNVQASLEALMDAYSGEQIGRQPRNFRLSELETTLRDEMRRMCEWRLGRTGPPIEYPPEAPEAGATPITVDEIILCLKRLQKSVKTWNKEGGMRGYLDFISQYIR